MISTSRGITISGNKKKIFKRILILAALLALTTVLSGCSFLENLFGGGKKEESVTLTWFDLTPGSSWTYHITEGISETEYDETTTAKAPETFQGQTAIPLESIRTPSPGGSYIQYFKELPDGIVQLGMKGLNFDNSYTETVFNPPIALPSAAKIGETISVATTVYITYYDAEGKLTNQTSYPMTATFTVVGEESITVPAGTFNTVKISYAGTGPGGNTWLAAGIGTVKDTSSSYNRELIAYSIK